ncbi:excalibur calcium-binding domain-containing protein [Sinomonas sp.]|uniref:excalibur calcium-binding domain-containing protein n=1 Tax=Sinomonas sp. TaxID=1914986 RepID=UPI002FE2FDB5
MGRGPKVILALLVTFLLLSVAPALAAFAAAIVFAVGLVWLFRKKTARKGSAAALIIGSLLVFATGCAGATGGKTLTSAQSGSSTASAVAFAPTPTSTCSTPVPDVTETATAESALSEPSPSASPSQSTVETMAEGPDGCPTWTNTVFVALYHSGESCDHEGDRYAALDVDLTCTKDRSSALVWMTKSDSDALAAQIKAEQDAAAARQAAAQQQAEQQAQQQAQQQAEQQAQQQAEQQAQQQPPVNVYYANCAAARAAGAAPIYRGQPGYRSALDRDGDGIACE